MAQLIENAAASAAVSLFGPKKDSETAPLSHTTGGNAGDTREWLARVKEVQAFWRMGGASSVSVIDDGESVREDPPPTLDEELGRSSDDEEVMMRRLRRLSQAQDHMDKKAYHGHV